MNTTPARVVPKDRLGLGTPAPPVSGMSVQSRFGAWLPVWVASKAKTRPSVLAMNTTGLLPLISGCPVIQTGAVKLVTSGGWSVVPVRLPGGLAVNGYIQ